MCRRSKEVDRACQLKWIYGPPRGQSGPVHGRRNAGNEKRRRDLREESFFVEWGKPFMDITVVSDADAPGCPVDVRASLFFASGGGVAASGGQCEGVSGSSPHLNRPSQPPLRITANRSSAHRHKGG